MQFAQWVLERNLHWIAAAEVKAAVIVAVDSAMLGALGTQFVASEAAARTAWAHLCTVVSAVTLVVAIFFAAMSVLPRGKGPAQSLIFFGRIAEQSAIDYAQRFRGTTQSDVLDDLLAQVHRNAQIAGEKFGWVRASMLWSFLAILPWIAGFVLLTKV